MTVLRLDEALRRACHARAERLYKAAVRVGDRGANDEAIAALILETERRVLNLRRLAAVAGERTDERA